MAQSRTGYGAQLRQIKDQLEELGDSVAPAVRNIAHEAEAPMRKLMGYAELAVQYAPQIAEIVGRLTSRAGKAAEATARPVAETVLRSSRSYRPRTTTILAGGLMVAAGLFAYGVASGRITVQLGQGKTRR